MNMETDTIEIPTRKPRKFLPDNMVISQWDDLKGYYEDLAHRTINSVEELEKWLKDRSELDAIVEEEMAMRYIKMTCDTSNLEVEESYKYFITDIKPEISPFNNDLNEKLLKSPYLELLNKEKYFVFLRGIKKQHEIYRKENISLYVEIETKCQEYTSIMGAMSVVVNDKELTIQQASKFLEEQDRELRQEAFQKTTSRKLQDRSKLDNLFSELVSLRHSVAVNAGFDNFRDYMFAALGRFDYTPEDCAEFQEAIKNEIVPINAKYALERKSALGVDPLRPWDSEVNITGKPSLVPFKGGQDLIDKSIQCFERIDGYLGECLTVMKEMKYLDLESRKGKAPGGYCYPMPELGVPFIFMNSVNSLRDVITMVHEGGHAIHGFLTRDLELTAFKNTPSEVAELASMSMEFISMEHWDVFFENEEELTRAKKEKLEKAIQILPWIAIVDKFQHWIYTNPNHTIEERSTEWVRIYEEFSSNISDWSGYEDAKAARWHAQLHIFEIPFYYIEYAMAQLGSIAVWKNYKANPEKGLQDYFNGLKLGYTKTIGEIYRTAGIEFNFSQAYVKELTEFLQNEIQELN